MWSGAGGMVVVGEGGEDVGEQWGREEWRAGNLLNGECTWEEGGEGVLGMGGCGEANM